MDFLEIAKNRQSCRSYDPDRPIEQEKLDAILDAAVLAPSACNGQPYHITVCTEEKAKAAAKATMGMGMNKFAYDAPVVLVISEKPYVKSAAVGSKTTGIDYRMIDMGIVTAYITAEATAQGIGSCIIGWIDNKKLQEICGVDGAVRVVITLGYATESDKLRPKKRKDRAELITQI